MSDEALEARRSRERRQAIIARRRFLAVAGLLVLVAVLVLVFSGGGRPLPRLPAPGLASPTGRGRVLAYNPARASAFVARATAGEAHVLYTKSPGGVLATAARVAAFRPLIVRATAGSPVSPNTLEGVVFLESAGYPQAIAGGNPLNAAGLTQIVASTGTSLLGMKINLARSQSLSAQIDRAAAHGQDRKVAQLERARAAIDDRFNPRAALAATVRYLEQAQRDFGRGDLALESYHMGIGNLQSVLGAYDSGNPVPYVQLYFGTAPDQRAAAYRLLSSFGDDSWTYYWRVLAAEQIMGLYRHDRAALTRLAKLQSAAGSAALVLHPPGAGGSFASPGDLDVAYAHHAVVPLPANPASLGLAYDPRMGLEARRFGFRPALYRGLRPAALALLVWMAGRVKGLSHRAPLMVTSTVVDQRGQAAIGYTDPPAAAGWSFTISRRYVSTAQAEAFQAVLDQLQSLNLIAWQRYPAEIEVTVASDAGRVLAHGV